MNPFLIKQWVGTSVWQSLNSVEVLSPAENVTRTLGEACLLVSKGPQGFLGLIQFPDPQGSWRLTLLCTWNHQDSWLAHWWLWQTSTSQAGHNYPRAEFGLVMSDELPPLQGAQGVMLLLFLFFFSPFFFQVSKSILGNRFAFFISI